MFKQNNEKKSAEFFKKNHKNDLTKAFILLQSDIENTKLQGYLDAAVLHPIVASLKEQ